MLAVWCIFVGRLLFVSVVIPPWQLPDEPSHFAVIRTLALQPTIELPPRFDFAVEAEVIASMARHNWWAAYEKPTPNPLPPRFEFLTEHVNHSNSSPALYYILASRVCRLLGLHSVMTQYYALRVVSVLLSLTTLLLIGAAARAWFDERIAVYTTVVVAMVPQFALIGIAVSPDPLVFLAAALIWWQGARLFSRKALWLPIITMTVAAIGGALAKQAGVVLIVQAALLMAIGSASALSSRRLARLSAAVVGGVVVGAVVISVLGRPDEISRLASAVERRLWSPQETAAVLDASYFVQFSGMLFTTAYLAGGWLRFWAPSWVYVTVGVATAAAMLRGVMVSFAARPPLRTGALVALLLVVVQIASVYGTSLYYQSGTQGRHLFAALGPFAALAAVGAVQWPSPYLRTVVPICGIALLMILDLASWATVIIPAYGH